MKLKLYYAPTTCALAPYVTLTEAGAEFECARINMRKAQHMSPEYMALNPKHKVPMLAIDDWLLTESVAIQTWIGRNFPAAKIMPADSNGEIKAISLMSWISGGIHPYLARINSPPKVADGADESVRRIAAREIDDNFTIADRMLAGREFFCAVQPPGDRGPALRRGGVQQGGEYGLGPQQHHGRPGTGLDEIV